LRRIIGVAKAFQTRVGEGPFPTELSGAQANQLRGSGEHPWDEYGTTTGRPRRVGWLDGVLLRYAQRLNSFTELSITKLDILSTFDSIRLCTAYVLDGKPVERMSIAPSNLQECEPEFETLPGWNTDITHVRDWSELPENAQNFILKIESFTGLPINLISVGPERQQVIRRT
jgi:adenylosuccinate synthase